MKQILLNLFGTSVERPFSDPYSPLATPTNANYCEKPTYSWIERPGYAISNIPFFIVGVWLLLQKGKLAKWFGLSAVIIGTFSMIYDVTFTHAAQYFDWLGMSVFIIGLLAINTFRQTRSKSRALTTYLLFLIAYIPLSYITDAGTTLFGGMVGILVLSEILIYFQNKRNYSPKLFVVSLMLFLIGWAIWQLDSHQLWCTTWTIFNGRAIFHYFTTAAIYFIYGFYKQFKELN